MAGLLYKDFVSIKGKRLCLLLTLFVLGFTILRLIICHGSGLLDLEIVSPTGETYLYMGDSLFVVLLSFFILFIFVFINDLVAQLSEGDKKNKIMNYIKSMPMEQHTYYAAKYMFIIAVAYVLFSIYCILSVVSKAFCMVGTFTDLVMLLDMFAPIFVSISLFFAAIELPMFIFMGKEKAMLVKDGIIILLALLVVGYLMFGDLSVFENFDFEKLLKYVNKNKDMILLMEVFIPIFVLVLYYLSYRITCFVCKKEVA